MAGMIQIDGLNELRRELRQAVDGTPRELSRAMLDGSRTILLPRVQMLAPRGKGADPHPGQLEGSFRAFSNRKGAGVRSDLPYAGVQEFAKQYKRLSRAGNTHTVTLSGDPPRFAYRALDQVAEPLADFAHQALLILLSCHGWLSEQ